MRSFQSQDTEIFYDTLGSGAPLVLLHPFPTSHGFWLPVAEMLAERYTVILPDLRAHGLSQPGVGPATMQKHAIDLEGLCVHAGIERATFVGCSIGGYILFEFLRMSAARVCALVLANTRATPDDAAQRAARQRSADEVLRSGPEKFCESSLEKLLGPATRRNRPDIVAAARRSMQQGTAAGIAAALQGMAARSDSVPMLKTINVPTLLLAGEEDGSIPREEMECMQKEIRGSELRIIHQAGHYAPLERPEEVVLELRRFLDRI